MWYLSDDADDTSPKELSLQSNMMVVENTIVSSDSKLNQDYLVTVLDRVTC